MCVHPAGLKHGALDLAPALYVIGSTGTSDPRYFLRSRRWRLSGMARTPFSPGCWTGPRCTAYWPKVQAFGLDLLEVRQLMPKRKSPGQGDNRSP